MKFIILILCFTQTLITAFYYKTFATASPSQLSKTTPSTSVDLEQKCTDFGILPPKQFLKIMLSSRSKSDLKSELMSKLKSMRIQEEQLQQSNSTLEGETNLWSSFLDRLFDEITSIKTNRWVNIRLPIPLPSYRMKLASALRVLNVLCDDELREAVSKREFTERNLQRRGILQLLSQLEKSNGVRVVEKEAMKSVNSKLTMEEMLQRTPQGLETPKYEVIERITSLSSVYKNEGWEVRQYDEFSVCSFVMDEEDKYSPSAFNSLAGYIFGKNRQQERMAMTTPVITSTQINQDGNDRSLRRKKMSFIMPSRYWRKQEIASAPLPMEDSQVVLESNGGGLLDTLTNQTNTSYDSEANNNLIAVTWFGGFATEKDIQGRANALLEAIRNDSKWTVLDEHQAPFIFQYNDPFQPPWKRRNEIAIPVKKQTV